MSKVRVGIIGAGGYGGCGAIEILCSHPSAEIGVLVDIKDVGSPISDLYPHLAGFCDLPLMAPDDPGIPDDLDVVFFSTPDRVGQKLAAGWLEKGVKVVDYSGDFRFDDLEIYKGYAARIGKPQEHASPELLPKTVYGLAELHRQEIAQANLVGNPGCFAVSCILGLAPAVAEKLVEPDSIICDAKTGGSGGGKNPRASMHFPNRYEAMNAYRISGHQHVYEVERELGLLAGQPIVLTFTPHVVPLSRGIMSTLYGNLTPGQTVESVVDAYRSFYEGERFIRVYGPDKMQISTNVRGSNFCNISINIDPRTNKLIAVSFIDNLLKGQAGSAVQNMNIMFGLNEADGLYRPGAFP